MLSFDLQCPYRLLSSYLDLAIDNAFGSDRYETHGVSLKLARRGDSFLNIDGNVIFINTIADIDVFKDVGLFSSAISGVIDISIAIEYEIGTHFNISTKSKIVQHKWVEKPKLEIGYLNMPVEKLVELALKHYEGIITAKLDAAIKEKVDLKSIISEQIRLLNQQLDTKTYNGVSLKLTPSELRMEKPKFENNEVSVKGGVVLTSNISSSAVNTDQPITFAWVEKIAPDNLTLTNIDISEKVILSIILDQIKNQEIGGKPLQLISPEFKIQANSIKLTAQIESPIKAAFQITAQPDFNESNQMFDLKNIQVKIDPTSLIYKLSAPLVNKFIESKFDSIFPVNLKTVVDGAIKNNLPHNFNYTFGNLIPTVKSVDISKVTITEGLIQAIIRINNANLSIKLAE